MSPVDTSVREEQGGGGALAAGAEIPLQQEKNITWRSTLEQITTLQSTEDPVLEQVDIP